MIRTAPIRPLGVCISNSASLGSRIHRLFANRFGSAQTPLDDGIADDNIPTKQYKRRALSCGRSRRKLEARRRDQEFLSARERQRGDAKEQKPSPTVPQLPEHKEDTIKDVVKEKSSQQNDNWHILKILEDKDKPMMTNPIRQAYIESQIKWKYPRTIEGWRICIRRAWNTYLWTWEGTLLSEKIRDERGNIIGVKKTEDDEEDAKETMREKATDAATHIARNVQKNVATMQQEAPKLLTTAQKLTGITTKEELKQWATEQLKLGTECLTMFMKGYRQGRDEEVDKMLHEYFNDLDEENQDENKTSKVHQMNTTSNDFGAAGIVSKGVPDDNRSWGRKARRQMKRREKLSRTEERAEAVA